MKRFSLISFLVMVVLAVIVIPQTLFTVDETKWIVITRFGEIRRVISEPGLNAKVPFIDTVNPLDNRVLRIDVVPTSMPDVENQFLEIDAYARYRIVDPQKFLEKLINQNTAESRLGQIIISQLRAEIGQRTQPEIIGGTLLGIEDDRTLVEPSLNANGVATREGITREIVLRADAVVKSPENDFGVEIIDVRIKRADFPGATQETIFNRMRSERAVQADKLRAEGQQEFLTRVAGVDRLVEVIAATADRESNELRGEGEAEAISILAEALERDSDFFVFLRTLEAYKVFLTNQTTAVLSADSPLFQYLQAPTQSFDPQVGGRPTE
jgi:membrane protease subunit HflC